MILFNLFSFLVILACSILLFSGVKMLEDLEFRALAIVLSVVGVGYFLVIWFQVDDWLVNDVVIISCALILGRIIGLALSSRAAVIVFCLIAALADSFAYVNGLTNMIIESYSSGEIQLLAYFSITAPFGGAEPPFIGLGDLIVLTTLFSGLNPEGETGKGAFFAPFSGLILASTVGLIFGGFPSVPFIAATTIIYVGFRQ
ncbi:hypothetical protein HQ531_10060 [bacterium]|nr:hypothetical protein [bacterium]